VKQKRSGYPAGTVTETTVTRGRQALFVRVQDGCVVQVELLPLGAKPMPRPDPQDPVLRRAAHELREYLAGKRRKFTVPFKQEGSPFQQDVWAALVGKVPYGRVVSYATLAEMAGRPKAARAVGTAMNRNRLPLLVPCHRVVASDGIGGYGYGLEWKKLLLDMEKSPTRAR
jgi:methylated-DNA-[protein]-cysteine S-methyltransferase